MYWVLQDDTRKLAIAPRPRGDDWLRDDLLKYRAQGVEHLVSALTRWEVPDLGLGAEARTCELCGIQFHNFPIEDQSVPESMLATRAFLNPLLHAAQSAQGIAFHGRSGVGRASLLAGALLLMDGWRAQDAWPKLSAARNIEVPDTEEQRRWLFNFEQMLQAGF